jgi:myo-inositol 2-dehydrogenase/D-chiro-inositol 1-dehydrogenase
MSVRVGVIGVGNIGQDHVRRLTRTVAGAQVVAVSDVDLARTQAVAEGVPGARALPTGQDVIRADEVDAAVVASWGQTHEEYVLAAIEARKPVLCENRSRRRSTRACASWTRRWPAVATWCRSASTVATTRHTAP